MSKLRFFKYLDPPIGCLIFNTSILIYASVAWVVNLVKLLNCDFAEPYKDEIVHLIGLVPGASMITCWF